MSDIERRRYDHDQPYSLGRTIANAPIGQKLGLAVMGLGFGGMLNAGVAGLRQAAQEGHHHVASHGEHLYTVLSYWGALPGFALLVTGGLVVIKNTPPLPDQQGDIE